MQTGLRWIWLTVVFFFLDQVSKYLAVTYIEPHQVIEVMPFFNLVVRYNPGAAFSFLADAGGWQVVFFTAISILVSLTIVIWLFNTPMKNRWLNIALSLILAGALGNLYDRVTLGQVIDFIDWYYASYHWPAFNVADSAIMLGALMMVLEGFFQPNQQEKPNKD